ncbi:MAG TPA: CinA family protein, partial [Candidatus Fournierella merdigallinarum]|nr:CinA family protein [Candidatus Fournierella merdigallinarum]
MEQYTSSLVLRLFGPQQEQVTQILRQAAAQGCPGLNLLMKNGEYAVCVTARAASRQAADEACRRWQSYFTSRFGDAVFCVGEESLAATAVQALAKAGRLVVAADEATGSLLNDAFAGCEQAGAVYDFGAQSYAHPKKGGRIAPPARLLKRYPDCPVQPVAGRAHEALRVSGADWAAAYQPADGARPGFVLVCGLKYAWMHPLPPSADEKGLAAGWLLDMLRRMALGLDMDPFVERFKLGGPAPVPQLPEAALAGLAAPRVVAGPAPTPAAAPAETPAPAAQKDPAPAPTAPAAQPAAPAPFAGKAAVAPGELLTPGEQLATAAQLLFDDEAQLPAETQDKPAGPHWGRIIASVLLAVVIAGGVGLWVWLGGKLPGGGSVLGDVGYGTADYDTAARDYLLAQQEKQQGVAAYLALPQLEGALVYAAGAPAPDATPGTVSAAEDPLTRFTGPETLGQSQSNVILRCPAASMEQLGEMAREEVLRQNSGFTLYTAEGDYRYKVAAVYEWDPAETGESAFDLYGLQDLSNYEDYLTFVLGVKARSLYEMPADLRDGDAFVTLVADGEDGRMLVITGRQLRDNEAAILFGNLVAPAEEPLMPLAVYQSQGLSTPDLTTLGQYWLNWYVTGGATSSDVQEEAGMPEEDRPLSEVGGGETVEPEATPDGEASPSPTPSATPDASASPKPSVSPSPTPSAGASSGTAPTAAPTPAP